MRFFQSLFAIALGPLLCLCSPLDYPGPSHVEKRAPNKWVHPGVLVDKNQLDFVKRKVAAKADPWYTAYKSMLNDNLVTSITKPRPVPTVACGSYNIDPNIGCREERQDAVVAYANALAFWISGEKLYANKAINFMNAWASTLKSHASVDSGSTNTPLQAGWSGASWSRTAELIAHSDAPWADSEVFAFKAMLRNIYLPTVIRGSNFNGNWELVMAEAALGISVFLEDSRSYDAAMDLYMARVPAYVYLLSDGDLPKPARGVKASNEDIVKYWKGQSTFRANGIAQETCRDLGHTGLGLSSISHVAETSRIQGRDLYTGDIGTRLRYALEFHAGFAGDYEAVPSWLCGGSLNKKNALGPVTEIGYNALSYRLNKKMTNTGKLTDKQRPAGTNTMFGGWETLTHAMNGA